MVRLLGAANYSPFHEFSSRHESCHVSKMSANIALSSHMQDQALADIAANAFSLVLDHRHLAPEQEDVMNSAITEFESLMSDMEQAAGATRRLLAEAESLLR